MATVRIAVTGSIATDHLMTFPGRFADQLMPDMLDKVALSFLVDGLEIRRGGVAANIAFGLGCLGQRPLLVGSVGSDFGDYDGWLTAHGVDTSAVRKSELRQTARFTNTCDLHGAHIGSFYAGAMAEDAEIELGPVAEAVGGIDLVLVGSGDPAAMLRFTVQCRELGIPFANDTSWQVARMDGSDVRTLIDGADFLFANEYEAALTEQKTGWSAEQIAGRVRVRVTTLGKDGALVQRAGQEPIRVPAAPVDPKETTGAGDAFRAGFLAAIATDLGLERAAQLGNMMAAHALETVGPQEYDLQREALTARFGAAYGDRAAADLAAMLAAHPG
jgi:adenosine kinase